MKNKKPVDPVKQAERLERRLRLKAIYAASIERTRLEYAARKAAMTEAEILEADMKWRQSGFGLLG